MTETEANIRRSILDTLRFLSSEAEQRTFASKVFYRSYQGEFACWWFDTFYPEDPSAHAMFSSHEFAVLKAFSLAFDQQLSAIGLGDIDIEQLLARPEWKLVIASAHDARAKLQHIINGNQKSIENQ